MQVTKINTHYNVYGNRNLSVSFKSVDKKPVSDRVINMLKSSPKNIFLVEELNNVNKYVIPNIQKRLYSYPNAVLNMAIVQSEQLPELLGERSDDYKLSLLQGICVVAADRAGDIENCNKIYETTVCLVPDPNPNVSLYEMLFK